MERTSARRPPPMSPPAGGRSTSRPSPSPRAGCPTGGAARDLLRGMRQRRTASRRDPARRPGRGDQPDHAPLLRSGALAHGPVRPARLRQEPAQRHPGRQHHLGADRGHRAPARAPGRREVDACSAAPGARPWRWPTPSPIPSGSTSLVLRGIFLLTQRELAWFYQDGASMLFPDAWERFLRADPRGRARRPDRRLPPPPDPPRPPRSRPRPRRPGASGKATPSPCADPRRGRRSSTRPTSPSPSPASSATIFANRRLLPRGRLAAEARSTRSGHPRLDRAGPLRRGHAAWKAPGS